MPEITQPQPVQQMRPIATDDSQTVVEQPVSVISSGELCQSLQSQPANPLALLQLCRRSSC